VSPTSPRVDLEEGTTNKHAEPLIIIYIIYSRSGWARSPRIYTTHDFAQLRRRRMGTALLLESTDLPLESTIH
jgi:hypothetical protein